MLSFISTSCISVSFAVSFYSSSDLYSQNTVHFVDFKVSDNIFMQGALDYVLYSR